MQNLKLLLCGLTLSIVPFMVISCGPRYEISYRYTNPPSEEGRSCVSECETIRVQCKQTADIKADREVLEKKEEYQECYRERRVYCVDESLWVRPDYSKCESDYRSCFERCGGKVTEVTEIAK
jgi:hypothetical protein